MHRWLELAEVCELDLAAIEREIVLEHDIHGGAAGEFGFGAAGQQNRGEPPVFL